MQCRGQKAWGVSRPAAILLHIQRPTSILGGGRFRRMGWAGEAGVSPPIASQEENAEAAAQPITPTGEPFISSGKYKE